MKNLLALRYSLVIRAQNALSRAKAEKRAKLGAKMREPKLFRTAPKRQSDACYITLSLLVGAG